MEKLHFEDYEIGEKFISSGRTITETDIVIYAALTGDWHQLHTNVEYAKTTVFKERIAHGMLTLVIGTALLGRLGEYVLLPKSFIAFYGMDKVRLTGPVKIGDTIHCEATVNEKRDKETAGIIGYTIEIKNQNEEIVASLVLKLFCGKR
jgi:acyl dehydratase